jgi:hypothetical protein
MHASACHACGTCFPPCDDAFCTAQLQLLTAGVVFSCPVMPTLGMPCPAEMLVVVLRRWQLQPLTNWNNCSDQWSPPDSLSDNTLVAWDALSDTTQQQ